MLKKKGWGVTLRGTPGLDPGSTTCVNLTFSTFFSLSFLTSKIGVISVTTFECESQLFTWINLSNPHKATMMLVL